MPLDRFKHTYACIRVFYTASYTYTHDNGMRSKFVSLCVREEKREIYMGMHLYACGVGIGGL